MELTRQHLEHLHQHMEDLLESVHDQEDRSVKNIRRTNTLLVIFTMLGVVLSFIIFSFFITLAQAIDHSIASMKTIEEQVIEVRDTMDGITSSVSTMGGYVENLYYMNDSIGAMAMKTGIINSYIAKLYEQTGQIAMDAAHVRYNTAFFNQRFSNINRSMGRISQSLYETAQPIKHFLPLP